MDRSSVALNTISKIKSDWTNKWERLNDLSNSTIDAIRKEVEAAKAEGKNAQPCYNDTASNSLKNISNLASSDVQRRCIDTAESSIKSELASFFDNLNSTGRALILQLDDIFLNCCSNDIFEVRRCLVFKLTPANIAVTNLINQISTAKKNTAGFVSNNIVLQGNNCVYNIFLSVMSQVAEVRFAATKCLKAL